MSAQPPRGRSPMMDDYEALINVIENKKLTEEQKVTRINEVLDRVSARADESKREVGADVLQRFFDFLPGPEDSKTNYSKYPIKNSTGYGTIGPWFQWGHHPLFRAMATGSPKSVQALLNRGANASAISGYDITRSLFGFPDHMYSNAMCSEEKIETAKTILSILISESYDPNEAIPWTSVPSSSFMPLNTTLFEQIDHYRNIRDDIREVITAAVATANARPNADHIAAAYNPHGPNELGGMIHAYTDRKTGADKKTAANKQAGKDGSSTKKPKKSRNK